MRLKSRIEDTISLRDDTVYARAEDKLAELRVRAGDLQARRDQLVSAMGAKPRQDDLVRRATALLEDDAVPRSADEDLARLRLDVEAIEDEQRVIGRAMEMQLDVVERERQRVSQEICARLRPQYRAIMTRIAKALRELAAANADEETLRQALDTASVYFTLTLRPMPFRAAGRLDDDNSGASLWLREARDFGLLDD